MRRYASSRRTFLTQLALSTLAAPLSAMIQPPRKWSERLGLQVYTVRDKLKADFERTFAKIAEAGYKHVELFGSLGERTPKDMRAILDRNGLAAPSTHIALAPGPDLDRQLEGCQVMGHRFTAVRSETGGARGGPPPANTAD